jgi:hypothetical protein
VKRVSLETAEENSVVNFQGPQFQSQEASINLFNKVRSTGLLLDKEPARTHCAHPRKLHEIQATSEHATEITETIIIIEFNYLYFFILVLAPRSYLVI